MNKASLVAGVLALMPALASAQEIEIEFTNLTKGIHLTPLLVAAHGDGVRLFRSGTAAGSELQALAEGGATGGVAGMVRAAGGEAVENPAGGLLAAGESVTFRIDASGHSRLSMAAMMLPTNDAFVGLDSWRIPRGEITAECAPADGDDDIAIEVASGGDLDLSDCAANTATVTLTGASSPAPGTYVVNLNAYDAGTEANDERIVEGSGMPGVPGIPVAPAGNGGVGGSGIEAMEPGVVRIHPGNIGDTDRGGGVSDVDSREHRWLNPVARAVITVPSA